MMILRKDAGTTKKDARVPSGKECWIPEKDAGLKEKMMDHRNDAGPQKRMLDQRKGRWTPERRCWFTEKVAGPQKRMLDHRKG
jgi:hypothetical protein